jgi:hypothetical protein
VTADQTTTLNIALEVTPTLTLSGYVRDAVSGVPLSGTVSILDSSIPPAHTNPTTGFYSLDLFLGTYTLRASAENYHPQNQVVHLTANQQQDFILQRTCLLVLDDDGGMAYDTYYTIALDRLGYDYRRVTQSPDLGLLSLYQGVIWLTGDQSIGTLTAADRSSLAAYLDGGGRLFLSGQDIGKDIGSSDFYRDYLHAAYLADNTGLYRLSGLDFLSGLTTIFILGPGGANNQTSPDEVVPANSGVPVYYYLDTSRYGAVAYSGTHRTVYFGFGYEAINQQSSRDAVMDAVLEYIGVCGTPQAPQAGFLSSLPDASGMVRFTNTSTGTPLMTYTWDFGDDTAFSTEANPEHTYLQVGQYTVVLTATSLYGQDTFSDTVEILPTYPVYLPILRKDTP